MPGRQPELRTSSAPGQTLRRRHRQCGASSGQMDLFEEKLLTPTGPRTSHRLIGQLFDTYWLVEYEDQLFIIDQHAAHEKMLYEKTMAILEDQRLRHPDGESAHHPDPGMGEELLNEEIHGLFHDMGFEIEHFGGREYAVRGVPAQPVLHREERICSWR